MKQIFISGTDTNCGKTYVTCKILEWLLDQNRTITGIKPIASVCVLDKNGQSFNSDIELLQHWNAKCHKTQLKICMWQFQPAIAPHIAAAAAKQTLSAAEVAKFCQQPQFHTDYLVVEGAGGIMVPLNAHETWIDVLKIMQIPMILIVGLRVGCINHALLTELALRHYAITCLGWIANCLDDKMLALDNTIATLQEKMIMPLLTTITYNGSGIKWSSAFTL